MTLNYKLHEFKTNYTNHFPTVLFFKLGDHFIGIEGNF